MVRTSALWGQPQGKTLSGLPCLFISLAASGNHLSSQEMTRGDQLLVQSERRARRNFVLTSGTQSQCLVVC